MAIKKMRIGFYGLRLRKKGANLVDSLRQMADLPDDQSRTVTLGEPIRMLDLSEEGDGYWIGIMQRIRITEALEKGKTSGPRTMISFDDDEGLSEHSGFLYDPGTNALLVEERQGGVGRTVLARYLSKLGQVGTVKLDFILKRDALDRVHSLSRVQKLEVRFKGIDNHRAVEDRMESVQDFFKLSKSLRAPKASFVFTMGEGGTQPSSVFGLIDDLLRQREETEEVDKILVEGTEDGDEPFAIDIVKDRLVEEVRFEVRHGQRISDTSRRAALRQAWQDHREDVEYLHLPE